MKTKRQQRIEIAMQIVTDEPTRRVDRGGDYNQTQEHDHRPGKSCWCGFGVGSVIDRSKTLNEAYDRPHVKSSLCPDCGFPVDGCHVCPKGAAQHGTNDAPTQQGKIGKPVSPAILEFRNKQLEEENRVLRERVAGFEKMTATLAAKIDALMLDFHKLTGKTVEEAIYSCGTKPQDETYCVLPKDHTGPCRSQTFDNAA